MKILHVVHSDAFAGVERHVVQLAHAQAERGDEVAVIGGHPARMRAECSPIVAHHPASTPWQTVRAVRSLVRKHPDVVHAHMTVAETAGAVALLGTRIPLVATRHFARVRGRNTLVRWVTAGPAKRISAQIAISRFVAQRVGGLSTVVHPGVPEQPDALAAAQRARTVLVVQRLEAEKRTDDALRIFAASGLAGRGWHLEVVGDGSQRDALRAVTRQLGIAGSTRFLGHRTDVAEIMGRSSFLIAPCPVEGLGLTVLEAMAAGLPVVAAAAGGHLETLEGLVGAVLYPASPHGLIEASDALGALAADEDLRDISAKALQSAQRERFTLTRQAESTEVVYRSVM